MAKYQLPNNKVLTVPDDLPPDNRAQIAAIVKRDYGIDIDETTVLGQAYETLKGIPRAAFNQAIGVPLGAASLFDIGNDSDFVQGLQQYKDYVNTESYLAGDPAYRDKWLTKFGEGLGSFVPFLGAAKLGQVARIRGIGGTSIATNPTFTIPAAIAVPSGISQQADRVDQSRALGEDVGGVAETFAELGGGVVGLTEILPIFSLFKRVPKNRVNYPTISKRISSALKSGGQEGLQEVGATLAQDFIARGLYSDKLPIGDSILDEFTIGGAVGALADLGVNAMSGRSIRRQYLRDDEANARRNKVSVVEKGKFKKAIDQGELEVISDIPQPSVIAPEQRLELVKEGNLFSIVDKNNAQEPLIEQFNNETDAIVSLREMQNNSRVKELENEIDNDTYSLGLQDSSTATEIGMTINDKPTTTVDLQTLVLSDSNLKKQRENLFAKDKLKDGLVKSDQREMKLTGIEKQAFSLMKDAPVTISNIQQKFKVGFNPTVKSLNSLISKGLVEKDTSSNLTTTYKKKENISYTPEIRSRKANHLSKIKDYLKTKNIGLKSSYTMPEIKKVLNNKDYQELLTDKANAAFTESESAGEPSIRADKENVNVNLKYIKDIAASKNIQLDFKDPAVRFAARQWTGTPNITQKTNRGVKELFLARLHSLPKFNNLTKFPDFRPRQYSAQDVANFVAVSASQNTKFSVKDLLKEGVTANNKAATEQFVNDLVTSGRAEKVEGTDKYTIRPNFQKEINKKVEGSNETIQEFRSRLEEEGKLSPQDINSAVEKETKRQAKALPPVETNKKIINLKEAAELGRTNKFAVELRKILKKMGLAETGVIVSDDILSTTNLVATKDGKIKFDPSATRATKELGAVEGEYDRETDIIFLSLNAVNPNGTASQEQILERLTRVLDHEAIHAFREKDLITESEYQYLSKRVKTKKVPVKYDSRFKGKTFYQRAVEINTNNNDPRFISKTEAQKEDYFTEEAIAEMFRARNTKPELAPKEKGILRKIAEFFKSMGRAMRISGFKRVSDIFNDIESGIVGARERGEIRTLRELDKIGLPAFSRTPTTDDDIQSSLERLRQRMQDRKPLNPQQQSIQDQLDKLEQELRELQSEFDSDVNFITGEPRQVLSSKIFKLENQIASLKNQQVEAGKEPTPPEDFPLFSRGKRFANDSNTTANKQLKEATEKAVEIVKQTPRGDVPYYNVNASDVALKSAIDFNEDATAKTPPTDLPKYSRGAVPPELAESVARTGVAPSKEKKSLGATLLDVASSPIENIKELFSGTRKSIVDRYSDLEKKGIRGSEENEEVRLNNLTADTRTISAIRIIDQARSLFRQTLTTGFITDKIDGLPSLPKAMALEISTRYNDFIEGNTGTGGLMQILAPLYADPAVDKEAVFGLYAKVKRVKQMQDNGKIIDSPVTEKDLESLRIIEKNYPEVVEAYENYQLWNNKLIDLAKSKGLLDAELADMWKEHSSYYPFYRDMVDDSGLAAPTIGGGYLTGNPLNIKMEGSKEAINVNPVEAIARNSLSILTASLKNDGKAKLIRDLISLNEARILDTPEKIKNAKNQVPIFENGEKKLYEVKEIAFFEALDSVGSNSLNAITRFVSMPSRLLRETVTRDPGFVVVNLLRDTLSATVTSGAPLGREGFIPVISTVKNMFRDISELEKFGIIGGYDFQADEGGVVDLMERARRQQGLSADNGLSVKNGFFKIWDGLGGLTTKSDGATRYAVYEAVYNNMKKRGFNEAQAQSEAAYQALEIINFGRRGSSPLFRVITAAIPFLNARIQGLDVLYRSASGQYSAVEKLGEGETLADVKNRIQRTMALRASMLAAITAIYYLLVSDTEEYKGVKREVRDDNWIIPLPFDLPPMKLPIPFEIGALFKVVPERLLDLAMGADAVEKSPGKSLKRQLGASFNVPLVTSGDIGIQAIKPLFEAIQNRNSFTDSAIVPYFEERKDAYLQSRDSTSQIANGIGRAFNISPLKVEHVLTGYTGSLGGYVLSVIDAFTRTVTGEPLMPVDLNDIPVLRRLFFDIDKAGGLQQQFYELNEEVQRAVASMNSLREDKRFDELAAYRENNKGVLNVRGQVNAINRYMTNWRRRRNTLLGRTDISLSLKSDMLRNMEIERDKRLAILPALKERADSGMLD